MPDPVEGALLIALVAVVLSVIDLADGTSIDHCLLKIDPLVVRAAPPGT